MKKLIPIALLFVGETLAIYSEVIAAKSNGIFLNTFFKMSGFAILAGFCLIGGYMFGIKYLQNIWIVSAISIASIAIIEPLITYFVFHELPSKGPLIGLILGILAILSALFIK
jgi:hypothetical protein